MPVTPMLSSRRRRLLRRSETVEDYHHKVKKINKRKLSLPPKVSKSKLYMSVSTIDRDAEIVEDDTTFKESLDRISDMKQVSTRLKKVAAVKRNKRKKRGSVVMSSDSDMTR